jgi:transposase InsO family protein
MICRDAEERLRVLRFWERHGREAAEEAFGVARRTLFAWRAQLRAGGGQPHALTPRSTCPKRRRQRRWPAPLIEEIRRLRTVHPNLGKEKLHRLLREFCQTRGWRLPSARTIGRLIADAPDKMRFAARRQSRFPQGRVTRRPRARKPKGYRPERTGDCVGWDSLERRRDGLRRHLITCADLASRFSFALGVRSLSSQQAELAWRLSRIVLPFDAQHVLSDNGSEFARHFHRAVTDHGATHWHTCPRTPKMNAHCERFNRTIQEEFVDVYEDLLFYDLPAFNDRLLEWLYWFNAERPHHALGLRTPLDILADHLGTECRMYWPSTVS